MNDELALERGIIERAKADPKSFEPLYKKYYKLILKFSYKRIDSLDDAYEVTANTFAKALTNIGKYTDLGNPFSSWLYRIAINEINQFYRDTNKKRTINIDETAAKYLAEESGRDKQELNQLLKKALQYLEPQELQLIELRFFEERPFSEVGEILEITENNAKVRTYRVIDKLKEIFSKLN